MSLTKLQILTQPVKSALRVTSPKLPGAFPNNPDSEQEIGDCMSCHRVTEAIFVNHQALVNQATDNSRKPLIMREAKEQRCHAERQPVEM